MRSDNVRKIEYAMRSRKEPVSVNFLQAHTRLSYSTVARALTELGAQQVPGTWPIEWSIGQDSVEPQRDIRREASEEPIIVPFRQIDSLPSMWNKSAQNVTSKLGNVKLQMDTNLPETIETFRNAAELFASITQQLESVADKPDWLAELGTDEKPEQFEDKASA